MPPAKNLQQLTPSEVTDFLDSHDNFLFDIDGVITQALTLIPGVVEALALLRNRNKHLLFVSNNSTRTPAMCVEKFTKMGISCDVDEFVTPMSAMLSHLQDAGESRKIYALVPDVYRAQLTAKGFQLVEPLTIDLQSFPELVTSLNVDPEVGVVIYDCDMNMNFQRLAQAAMYLKNKDIEFYVGATDKIVPIGENATCMGTGYFIDLLCEMSGRSATEFAKPSAKLYKYLIKHKLPPNSKSVFVGDSIESDITFGNDYGFTTLLVFSGITTEQMMRKAPENVQPRYFMRSLDDLREIIAADDDGVQESNL